MIESMFSNEFWLVMIRFLIGSTLVLSAIWLLERTGWNQSLRQRSSLWKVGVLCSLMLLIPIDQPFAPNYQFEQNQPTALGVASIEKAEFNRVQGGASEATETIDNPTASQLVPVPAIGQSAQVAINFEPQSPVRESSKTYQLFAELDLSSWLMLLWACTSFILLLRLATVYVLGQRSLGRRQKIEADDRRYKVMSAMCQDIGISTKVKLTQSSRIISPVTLLNDEICLPEWSSSEIGEKELQSLLAHELGHIKTRDLQTRLGMYLLSCIFFFQPLFFLARCRLQNMSEFLADEFAANHCGSKPVANVLLSCAEKIQNHRSYPWGIAMLDNTARLKNRIIKLQQEPRDESQLAVNMHRITIGALCLSIFAVPSFEYGEADDLADAQLSELVISENAESQEIADAELNDGGLIEAAVSAVMKPSLLAVAESISTVSEITIEPASKAELVSSDFALPKIAEPVPEEMLEPATLVPDVVEQAQTFDQPDFDLLVQADAPEVSPVNIVESQQELALRQDQSGLSEPQANDAVNFGTQSEDLPQAESQRRWKFEARTPGTLRPTTMRRISRIQDLMSPKDLSVEPDYEAAKEILDSLYEGRYSRANSFEKVIILTFFTSYYLALNDYGRAIDKFEEILAIDGIGEESGLRALKSLGTLHSIENNWQASLGYFQQWREVSIEEEDVVFKGLSGAHYQMENYEAAIPFWLSYMGLQLKNGEELERNDYAYLHSLYLMVEDFEKALEVTREMIFKFNDPRDRKILQDTLSKVLTS